MKHSVIAVGYDWPLEIRNKDRLYMCTIHRRGAKRSEKKSFKRQFKRIESPSGMKKGGGLESLSSGQRGYGVTTCWGGGGGNGGSALLCDCLFSAAS